MVECARMKRYLKKRGFIIASVVSVFALLLVIGTVVRGYSYITKLITIKQMQEESVTSTINSLSHSLAAVQKDLEVVQQKLGMSLESLEDAKKVNAELSKSLQEERTLSVQRESKLRAELTNEVEAKVATVKTASVSSVIKEWRPRIAAVSCTWKDGRRASGSGLLLGKTDAGYRVQTNRHVVYDEESQEAPVSCRVQLPDDEPVSASDLKVNLSQDSDSAAILIEGPTAKMQQYALSVTSKFCSSKPQIGEKVVVLGYPSIGAKGDITATEGIISGFEDNYYITSAKIEQGNSGGAAISLEENCYIGIPTLTRVGRIEALGRVLDWRLLNIK